MTFDDSAGAAGPPRAARRGRLFAGPVRRSRLQRRLFAGVRLLLALVVVGGIYTAFAPGSQAEDTPKLSEAAQLGKRLYDQSCATCHGPNAQGVKDRAPSLIGVGSADVEFQVETGRMPAARPQQAQVERKQPLFTVEQAQQMGAYIQELGGGPQLPAGTNLREGGDIAKGGQLFRVNCASCHAFSTNGGALSSGKYAPSLKPATDREIYAAMLSGPQNMPVFGDNQITPQEKRDIIAYIQYQKGDQDPGGFGLGRYGPVPEALVIFLVGMVSIMFVTLWIAGKS
ncbi:c-type cytochrome [Planosporangium thailandense]|uniref:Cytochrome bc1 complex cytochrome c subunit n=1 Tax=Planosporangium thailandense TaxID=765197 RepID=A0ABX0XUK4_9ACTN|nr:cytochrome c [Planosporangium thailandense]NJC69692.1 c-type cytochrome [Planosporangium thailandense]